MTVDSFSELKQALIEKGMKPMGWPQVAVKAEGAASVLEDLDHVRPRSPAADHPRALASQRITGRVNTRNKSREIPGYLSTQRQSLDRHHDE